MRSAKPRPSLAPLGDGRKSRRTRVIRRGAWSQPLRVDSSGGRAYPPRPPHRGQRNARNGQGSASDPKRQEPVLGQISSQAGAARQRDTQAFAAHFFRHVPADDIASRDAADWARIAQYMFEFIRQRAAGTAKIRVFNAQSAEEGFESSHTMIAICTDDMPFLVDSVSMAINQAGLTTHAVIHPIFSVDRDPGGHVLALGDEQSGHGGAESIMLFEIERLSDANDIEALRKNIVAAVEDVRCAVTDWPKMKAKMLEIAEQLPNLNLPFDKGSLDEAQEFLRWIADDHFTFVGYREYRVVEEGGEEMLKPTPGSGLGIMRGDEKAVVPRALKTLAARDLEKSGSVGALILTKTNARSRVHRPGHMDYLSVLGFDAKGKPVVEQRFLGMLTSSAYMTPPREVPLLRNNYETILQRSGLKRDSHSGKALRHILDTLPRDEVFQCSTDELFDIAMAELGSASR